MVKFTTTSPGENTNGSFELYLDGSDVGLTDAGVDVDAVKLMDDGRVLVSTRSSFSVPGVSGNDEDIIEFTPTSLGDTTAGSWVLYFDGSDVAMTGSGEDVDVVVVDSLGKIYLSTTGTFAVSRVSGADEDVFVFAPASLGDTTAGSFRPHPVLRRQRPRPERQRHTTWPCRHHAPRRTHGPDGHGG